MLASPKGGATCLKTPPTKDRAKRGILEAAGFEPASESTPSQNSTCVAALDYSRPPSKSDGNRRTLAPENLIGTLRRPAHRPAFCYDVRTHPEGEDERDVAT